MYELAKMFLHCLNNWNYESPSLRRQVSAPEAMSAYKINYTRSITFLILKMLNSDVLMDYK